MNKPIHNTRRNSERGQTTILVVMALSVFLLGFTGLATDYTTFWFQRQSSQGASDATCQAAAVDMLLYAEGAETGSAGFTPSVGSTVDCATTSAAPCAIAKLNGFDAKQSGTSVKMTFPATVGTLTGITGLTSFVQVDVTNQAPAYFSRLLTGKSTVNVHTQAVCGLISSPGPVPIIVLHPTDPATLSMNGNQALVQVLGGPRQSIQINSNNPLAVSSGSLTTIDLSKGGPFRTGSSFGTFGGQSTEPPSGISLGSTGSWLYPSLPISDPYAAVPPPSQPANGTKYGRLGANKCSTLGPGCFSYDGCPDPSGCDEYTPGYYGSGISVNGGSGSITAIFRPGVYYIGGGGLDLDSNSTVRVTCCGGTADGDGSGGVMFYFSGNAGTSLYVKSNSGSNPACDSGLTVSNCVVQYHVNGATETGTGYNGKAWSIQSRAMMCPSGGAIPSDIPATITGNVLLAPCSGTYGDPSHQYRGFLFFQDRSIAVGTQNPQNSPNWQGGGSTLAAGFMYFHQCRSGDHTGTGRCTAFGDVFNMGGNPGSGSYAVGSLITDKIAISGNPGIKMILNPNKEFGLVKVAFFK